MNALRLIRFWVRWLFWLEDAAKGNDRPEPAWPLAERKPG